MTKLGFLSLAIIASTSTSALAFDFGKVTAHYAALSSHNSVYVEVSDEVEVKELTPSEAFIDTMGKTAVSFLANETLSQDQKRAEFEKLLKKNYDMKTIGRFALGKNWNLANDAQQKEYLKLFEQMVVDVYSQRFDDYEGQRFEVRASRDVGKSDQLINTVIIPDSGPEIDVDWRVRTKDGKRKIIDVIIEGVSMSLTQRSDFSSVIQRGGGTIEPLLEHLRSR
ncbi:MAG: ABC transporter substrate-binding protein [Alphaproteobacteria bacterium]|nr:ABC transporter substrate-binding protein [Alphaproteobacteria bacterium]